MDVENLTVTRCKPFRGFLEIYGYKKPELLEHLDSEIAAYQPHIKKAALQRDDVQPNLEFDTVYLALSVGKNKYHRCTVLEKRANNKVIIELIDYAEEFDVDASLLLELDPMNGMGAFLRDFPPIATKYILANFFCTWKLNELTIIESLLKMSTLPITNEQTDREHRYISLHCNGIDLATKLINSHVGMEISFTEQRMEVRKLTQRFDVFANGATTANGARSPARREKRRNLVATRPLQAPANNNNNNNNNIITDQGKQLIQNYIAPSQKTVRASFQPDTHPADVMPVQTSNGRMPAFTANELPPNIYHTVYCSYIENGPNEFYIQLKSQEHVLDRLSSDLSSAPRIQLMSKMPINMSCIGMACIARFSEDQNLYRAVIHKVHTNGCRVIFVDFGNSELVPLNELYEIPFKFLEHKTFAMPFELHRCKELGPIDDRLKKSFSDLVTNATLDLKVIPTSKSTAQQCELFLPNGENVWHLLLQKKNELSSFPNPPHLMDGDIVVIRSAVTAKKFFVQRVKDIPAFDRMMDALLAHCHSAGPMSSLPAKDVCCAAMVNGDMNEWYRVIVTNQIDREHVRVLVVDYGFEMRCHITHLREIIPHFFELPRQAIECCLDAFEDIADLPDSTREKIELFIDEPNGEPIEYKVSMHHRSSSHSSYVVDLTNDMKEISVSLSVYKLAMPRRNFVNKAPAKPPTEIEKPPRVAPTATVSAAPTNRGTNNWTNVREIDGAEAQERYNEAVERQKERSGSKNQNVMERLERVKAKNDNLTKSPTNNGATRTYGNRSEYDNRRSGDMNKKPILQKHIIPRFNKRPNRSRNNHNGKRTIGLDNGTDMTDDLEKEGASVKVVDQSKKLFEVPEQQQQWNVLDQAHAQPEEQTSSTRKEAEQQSIQKGTEQPKEIEVEQPIESVAVEEEPAQEDPAQEEPAQEDPAQEEPAQEQSTLVPESIAEETILVKETMEMSIQSTVVQRAPSSPIVERELVFITHVDHPNRFYIQLNSDTEALESFQQTLQIVGPQLPPLKNFRAGELCIGKYAFDDGWYRARIIDSDSEITSIQFIDYGNTDSITDNSLLKTITDNSLIAREPFAMACSLPIAPHDSSEWTEAACNKLRMLTNDSPMEFELVSKDNDVNYVKLFFVGGRDLVKEMIQEEMADPLEIIKSGETCFVCHINSLDDFFIQVDSDSEVLAKIEQHLASDNDSVVLTSPSVGTICSALFEDGAYYRARVLNILPDSKYDVVFLDYGNTFQTMEVRSLSPEIIQIPHLRKRCYLKLPDNVESWSDQAEQKFREISSDGATEFQVRLVKPGKKACIELYLNDQNESAVLGEMCEKKRMPLIPEDEHDSSAMEVTSPQQHSINVSDFPSGKHVCGLTHANSPDDFYIQFYSKSEDLTAIQTELANAYEHEALEQTDVPIGSIVAALYPMDNFFYRAMVLEHTPNGTIVLFIDYGNTCTVMEMRKLSDIISTIVPLAAHCTLANDQLKQFTPSDNAAFMNFMLEEPEPAFQVEAISTMANKTTVKFYRDDMDILDFIQSSGSHIDQVATTVLSDIIEQSVNGSIAE